MRTAITLFVNKSPRTRQKGKMKFDLFELSVAVPSKHGTSKIPEYGHAGLSFVEGRKNQPYTLKLRNDSAGRVLAVVSIDGLNVVDGQPCTPQSRGYVVPAYSTVEIEGWRTSLTEVHRFKFEAKQHSYAKGSTGEVQNCGVIAAKFFSEKFKMPDFKTIIEEHHHHHHHHEHPVYPIVRPWRYPTWPEIWYTTCGSTSAGVTGNVGPSGMSGVLRSASSAQYSASVGAEQMKCSFNAGEGQVTSAANMVNASLSAEVPDFKLGTGWGEAKADSVSETLFERDKELCTLTLYYAEAADLERVGIKLAKEIAVTSPATPALPQAFPGFCKPPVSR